MFRSRTTLWVVGGVALVVGGIAIGNIEMDLSPELQGTHQIEGKIVSCEFSKLTKNSDKFFVGIVLDTTNGPYLRANPLHKEKTSYELMCSQQQRVRVLYIAKKRLIGPIRYWVEKVETIET